MRLWVSGYRSYELGVFKLDDPKIEVLKYCLRKIFIQNADLGLEWIISGGQLGIEQWALEEAVSFTQEYIGIKTALMYPYTEFSKNWQEDKQIHLAQLEQQVDFCASVSKRPYSSPLQLKHTDKAVLIYDQEHPGKPKFDYEAIKRYQQAHAYELEVIDMYQLQDEAEQYLEQKNDR